MHLTEQPTTPETAADDAAAIEGASEQASAQSEPGTWNKLFGFLSGKKPSAPAEREGAAEEQPTGGEAPSTTLTLTPEELDRRIQAETDRREAKRQKDAAAKAEQDRREAIERKLDPNSGEFDPYDGAEQRAALKREEQTSQQFAGLLQSVGQSYDAATLDVITAAVPKSELERILKLEGAGVGLDGRKLIVSEALKALEKHWKAEGAKNADSHLREDPIFRKRVFAEHRDEVDEPELLPASGSNGKSGDFMNQIFDDYQALKGRRRRS